MSLVKKIMRSLARMTGSSTGRCPFGHDRPNPNIKRNKDGSTEWIRLNTKPTTDIILIWAEDAQGIIGDGQTTPWNVPDDLAHFKQTTMGSPLIMGRKTYESLKKELVGRQVIVLTRNDELGSGELEEANQGKVQIAHGPQEALDLVFDEPTIYIAGGAEVYQEFLGCATHAVVSYLDFSSQVKSSHTVKAPVLEPGVWQVDTQRSDHTWRPVSGDAAWRVVYYRHV